MRLGEHEMVEAMLGGAGEFNLAPCGRCATDEHADCVSFEELGAWDLCGCPRHDWD
jgi:hypothetical protein